MRSPRLGFSVRRMMAAVAVAALLLGAGRELQRLLQRRAYFRGQADAWASRVDDVDERRICPSDALTAKWDWSPVQEGQPVPKNHIDRYWALRRAYCANVERRYRIAANRPWRCVEPGPWPSDNP
jgi:hypothetical protein